jgi:hypothetical protein
MRKFRAGRTANDNEIARPAFGTRRRLILSVTALAAIAFGLALDPHPPAAMSLLALFLTTMVVTTALSIRRQQRDFSAAIDAKLDQLRRLIIGRTPGVRTGLTSARIGSRERRR